MKVRGAGVQEHNRFLRMLDGRLRNRRAAVTIFVAVGLFGGSFFIFRRLRWQFELENPAPSSTDSMVITIRTMGGYDSAAWRRSPSFRVQPTTTGREMRIAYRDTLRYYGSPLQLVLSKAGGLPALSGPPNIPEYFQRTPGLTVQVWTLDATARDLGLREGDIVDAYRIKGLIVDIGTFGEHRNTPGVHFLRGAQLCNDSVVDTEAKQTIPLVFDATTHVTSIDSELLPTFARRTLVKYLDEHAYTATTDSKVSLTLEKLSTLLGESKVEEMLFAFGGRVDEVKLRRVRGGSREVINFHTDHAMRTMQIALNDEREYCGGHVTYATASGFQQATRSPGFATIHDNTVVHGVTEITTGVRYSLFFLTLPD